MARRHVSICPIRNATRDDLDGHLPLKLGTALYFEEVSTFLKETGFEALAHDLYSAKEVEKLKSTRYGLVRYFEREEYHDEDEESNRVLYELYLGLKLVRPTGGTFQVLHYDVEQTVPRMPRGWRNNIGTLLSDCESLNTIRWKDLQELQALAPSILSTLSTARNPIAQAVHSMEVGYRAEFYHVRHLLWVVGLDALFTSTEWENRGAEVAIQRIEDFLGADFEIYSENRPDFEFIDLKLRELPSPKHCKMFTSSATTLLTAGGQTERGQERCAVEVPTASRISTTRQCFPKQHQRFCVGV